MNWIWSKHFNGDDKDAPVVMLFRKTIELKGDVVDGSIKISADTKYKLYVNGAFVQFGPSRGDKQVWYYNTFPIHGTIHTNGS